MLVNEKKLEDWIGVDASQEFETLIWSCLKVDPEERISAEDIVKHDFFMWPVPEQSRQLA